MAREKSLAVSDRLGVYKRLSDVPHRYRLHHHEDAYRDRDVWQEFCDQHEYAQSEAAQFRMEVDRVGRRWKSFMDSCGRHHALAEPKDVDVWIGDLRDSYSIRTVYEHWSRVNRFYDWLLWHANHPHVYNPALMAAGLPSDTNVVWEWWKTQIRQRRADYRRENR